MNSHRPVRIAGIKRFERAGHEVQRILRADAEPGGSAEPNVADRAERDLADIVSAGP